MQKMAQGTTVIIMGPAVSTDGITAATGATLSTARIFISKNDAVFTAKASTKASSADTRGNYRVFLTTVDSGTPGRFRIEAISSAEMLMMWEDRQIVAGNVYDAGLGTDYLLVDVLQIGGSSQSQIDLKDFADVGYDPGTNKVQGVVLVDTVTDKSSFALTTAANDLITDVKKIGGSTQSLTDLKDFADAGYDPGTNKVQGVVLVDGLSTVANDLITDVKKLGGSTQSMTDLKDFSDVGYDPVAHDVETVKVVLALTANNDKTAYALTTVANDLITDVKKIGGSTQSLTDLKDFADAGYDPTANKVNGVKLTDDLTAKTGYALTTANNDLITTNLSTFAKGDTVGKVLLTTGNNDLITTKLSTFAKGDTVGKVLLTTAGNDLITTNLSTFKTPAGIPKGTTFTLEVFMLSTDGKNPATESTVSAFFGPDGATFSTATNAVAETRHGWYKVDMTAAEMDYKEIKARFTATTCEDRNIVLIPSETA